jgi:signal transduction histidine kinase
MVIVFGYILYYTKLNIFATLNSMLQTIAAGGIVDVTLIDVASKELDQVNLFILGGMVVFAMITGVIAAHITLVPTRDEFSQRKRFITAVAHELRTPIAVLRTSNEVALYDVEDDSPMKKVLLDNIEETKSIANILNNLVIFSRVGTAESLSFEMVSIHEALSTALEKLKSFAHKKSVTLIYEENAEVLPLVYANRTALEQTFYNLIKNAVIYSKPNGGELVVKTFANATYVAISFTDNGIGMTQKNLKHIFEPFYRINPDNSPSSSGTGLGLALVFEIMKIHKGTIDVESTEGEGTTFTLQLPLPKTAFVHEPLVQSTNKSISYSFE